GVATSSDRDDLVAKALEALKAKQAASKRRKDREKPIPTPVIADERLLELATLRADAIKGILISRYKIGADRLFSCHSQIDAHKDAVPRVELGI
ncbi:MAG: hypothetical protein HKM22_02835, partial [Gammaproteobacteria bacterium]|nr:hypothetical protein [Gammaproteobacteria bacterium]